MPPRSGHRSELDLAFGAFETALREALEREAQRSIDKYLKELKSGMGYTVAAEDISVRVARLHVTTDLATSGPAGSPRPNRRAAKKPASKKGTIKRGVGSPRQALLDVLNEDADRDWSIDEIRSGLAERRVEVSATNLHQLLRRLSQSGQVERIGRGEYRAAAAEAA